MTEQEREREEGGRVALRLGTGRRAQGAVRSEMADKTALLLCLPLLLPLLFPLFTTLLPLLPLPAFVRLAVSLK